MSKILQVCLLVGSIFVLYIVVKSVLKNKIYIHYAIVWLFGELTWFLFLCSLVSFIEFLISWTFKYRLMLCKLIPNITAYLGGKLYSFIDFLNRIRLKPKYRCIISNNCNGGFNM